MRDDDTPRCEPPADLSLYSAHFLMFDGHSVCAQWLAFDRVWVINGVFISSKTAAACGYTYDGKFNMDEKPDPALPRQCQDNADVYLIWSVEHQKWWGPRGTGYAGSISEAGRYSHRQAIDLCLAAIPGSRGVLPELPVNANDLMVLRERFALRYGSMPACLL